MNRLPVVAPNTRPSFHASNKMRTPDRNQLSHARSGIALIGIILEFAFISVVIAVILIVTNHFLKSQAASLAGQDSAMIQPIFRLSVVSDGRSLWVQRGQKEIDLVEIATGVATKRLRFSESTLTEMRVSDDGLTCLVAIEDQELCIFRDQQLQAVDPAAAGLSSLYGLSPNGRIAVRVLGGTSVRGWDLGQEDPRPFSFVLPEPAERIALDSTGERMLVSTGTGKHSLYEIIPNLPEMDQVLLSLLALRL